MFLTNAKSRFASIIFDCVLGTSTPGITTLGDILTSLYLQIYLLTYMDVFGFAVCSTWLLRY